MSQTVPSPIVWCARCHHAMENYKCPQCGNTTGYINTSTAAYSFSNAVTPDDTLAKPYINVHYVVIQNNDKDIVRVYLNRQEEIVWKLTQDYLLYEWNNLHESRRKFYEVEIQPDILTSVNIDWEVLEDVARKMGCNVYYDVGSIST